MRVIENVNKLYLLVDIDDFLVHSSDKLQETLDEKTNFKTETLNILEQINRNCRYLVNEIKKECKLAKEEGRLPNINRFPIFHDFALDNMDDEVYNKPVEMANYYLQVANSLLNQFLEERDTFLEIDNMPKGEIKKFNYEKEMKVMIDYFNLLYNNQDALNKINKFCFNEAKRLIKETLNKNTPNEINIPNYGDLVSMDTNDIIKKNSIVSKNSASYRKSILYLKPLHDIAHCVTNFHRVYDIISNAEVFYTPSKEIVDYSSIHSLRNVNWEAVSVIESLIHSGMFAGVYLSTHHNGDREEKAKQILMKQILPEADGFIGQRFHDTEHDGLRRGRSSKIDTAVLRLGVEALQLLLFDDSKANCKDCKDKGGTEILYKPITDSEIINNKVEETGFNRVTELDNKMVYGIVAQAFVKQKNKVKIK